MPSQLRSWPGARAGVRFAIGPENQVGQATNWVQAAFTHLGVPGLSFAYDRLEWLKRSVVKNPRPMRTLPTARLPLGPLRAWHLRHVLRGVTHVGVEGFRDIFAGSAQAATLDLDLLTSSFAQVAFISHGSDLRDPDAHAQRWSWSYVRECEGDWMQRTRAISSRNRQLCQTAGLRVFCSTPDLLLDVPSATWLPLTIDAHAWTSTSPPRLGAGMSIAHVPSRRTPPIKGTATIDKVMAQFSDQIRYVSPGQPVTRMKSLLHSCDVVIDQISSGSYGVATVEALAAGRLVIGNVAPQVRALVDRPIPIVQAEPDQLAAVIAAVIADPAPFAEVAAAGPDYVKHVHDGRGAAAALRPFLSA